MTDATPVGAAIISDCGQYRYRAAAACYGSDAVVFAGLVCSSLDAVDPRNELPDHQSNLLLEIAEELAVAIIRLADGAA